MSTAAGLLHHPLAVRLGLTLLHFLWQGAALALVGLLTLGVLGRARPSCRYLALLALLAAMAASPVLTFVFFAKAPPPAVITTAALGRLMKETAQARQRMAPGAQPKATLEAARQTQPPGPDLRARLLRAGRWLRLHVPWAVGFWACGVALLSLRLLTRWRGLRAMVRAGAGLSGPHSERLLARMTGALRVSRPVRLIESAAAHSPLVVGWLRPVIVLPPAALLGLDPWCLEAILAHELAHIRRHDYAVNLAQTVVETLLFHHPAVWWLSHRIRVERERCCDDIAAAACGDAAVYGSALAALAGMVPRVPDPALGANRGPLVDRIRRVLGAPGAAPERHISWAAWLAPLVVVLTLAAGIHAAALAQQIPREGTLLFQTATGGPAPAPDRGAEFITTAMRGGTTWTMPHAAPPVLCDLLPTTEEIVYAENAGDTMTEGAIWKAPMSTLRPVNLTGAAGVGGLNCTPRWSPDGSRISFWHAEPLKGQKPCEAGFQVWVMNADGSRARPLTPEGMEYAGGAWSPDGRQLLAQGQPRSGTGETVAVAINVTTGRARRLAEVGVNAAWSPDGSAIASVRQPRATVAGQTGRRTQLILTNADGTHPRVLLEQFVADEDSERGHPADENWKWGLLSHVGPTSPVWSPSGQEIAFLAALPFDADGPTYPRQIEVWIYDLPTGRLTRVTHDDRWQLNLSWRQ